MTTLFAATQNPGGSESNAAGASFFIAMWVVILIGAVIHVAVDRHKHGHRPGRGVELSLLWVMVFGGAWAIWGGILHTSGSSEQLATSIGYAPSMFQWEVGWGDIALGVLGVACAWKAFRGQWLTAAVVVLAIQYGGDGIGHIMQYVAHDNTAPDNVWAIPSDFLQPIVAIVLLVAYRRHNASVATAVDTVSAEAEVGATTVAAEDSYTKAL
jgi:hypothetical protein